MVRLFIGVSLPEEVVESLSGLREAVSGMPAKLKLVEPENLHVSLSFLGERPEGEVAAIARSLDDVCRDHRRFSASLGRAVLIPSRDHIRVVALEVGSSQGEMERLRSEVAEKVGGESHPAHLTIARVREVRDREFISRAVEGMKAGKYFEVSSVLLVRSVLTRRGPRYEVLHESRLA